MTYIKRATLALTTLADGSLTAYTEQLEGMLQRIRYVKPGANPLADTVDFTITEEDTGAALLSKSNVTASFTSYPRAPINDVADEPALYADEGEAVLAPIPILGRIKVVLAQGGDTKQGTLIFDLA